MLQWRDCVCIESFTRLNIKRSVGQIVLVSILLLFCFGCASTLARFRVDTDSRCDPPYAGLRVAAKMMSETPYGLLLLPDLPVSALCDTLWLPSDLMCRYRSNEYHAKLVAKVSGIYEISLPGFAEEIALNPNRTFAHKVFLNGELKVAESGSWKLSEIGYTAYLEPFTSFSDGWNIIFKGRRRKPGEPTLISVDTEWDKVEKVDHVSLSFSSGHRLKRNNLDRP
jgi:uncharacterized protein YceK